MRIVTEVYASDNVHIRLVCVKPGESAWLERHEHQNVVSIPLSNLERGANFETLRGFLLNYVPPNEYYSLNPVDEQREENFLQIIWNCK